MFVVEGANQTEIKVRHKQSGHVWRFKLGRDADGHRRIVLSGISEPAASADVPAAEIVSDSLRFAIRAAVALGLIDPEH